MKKGPRKNKPWQLLKKGGGGVKEKLRKRKATEKKKGGFRICFKKGRGGGKGVHSKQWKKIHSTGEKTGRNGVDQ